MVTPFKLDHLKKISKREVDLTRALYEYLPATDVRDKIHVEIRKTLMNSLGQDLRYFTSKLEWINVAKFVHNMPEVPCLAFFGLEPIDKRAIIYIDSNIADVVINKLLGGAESIMTEARAFTETEQGVLQYLIMQVLKQIYILAGAEPRVHFRFQKFAFSEDDISKIYKGDDMLCVLNIEVSLMDQAGFIRIAFPNPFLEEMSSLLTGAGNTKAEREYFAEQISKWGFVKSSLWAEAGNTLLSPIEIRDLEEGDVILLDKSDVELKDGKLSGDVFLHYGTVESGVKSKLKAVNKKNIQCKLEKVFKK